MVPDKLSITAATSVRERLVCSAMVVSNCVLVSGFFMVLGTRAL